MQFMGDYWLRHIRPDYTEIFATELVDGIKKIFQSCVGIDFDAWTEIAKERMRLPIRFKGLGLRQAADRRYPQYIGALTQSTPQLINRSTQNNTIP
jgi:hypothetical protein